MCGFISIFDKQNQIDEKVLSLMRNRLNHRGPDSKGNYISEDKHYGVGHTRLSILDISQSGKQPMRKHGLVIAFNGEIFNYKDIREELIKIGYKFDSSSDTEVILSAFDKWGIRCLSKFNGFFSFIIYIEKSKEAFVVRDRLGIKQLVYYVKGNTFLASSEIKAILTYPSVKKEPNLETIQSDLIFNFFSDKKDTYFKNIYHLQPGHYIHYKNGKINVNEYWSAESINEDQLNESRVAEYIENLYFLLTDSISLRLNADVPLALLLSGGIDSSIITQIASQKINKKLYCFSLKYHEIINEDLLKAKLLVSRNNKLKHELVKVGPSEFNLDLIDKVTYHMEEILLDRAYVSVYKNYEAAKNLGYKIVLNGQGADEIWLGYYNFYDFLKFSIEQLTTEAFKRYWLEKYFLKEYSSISLSKRIINSNLEQNFFRFKRRDVINSLIRFFIKTHLQSMNMQEDRLAMANSVECRLPFLDYRVVELSLKIPSKIKIYDGREKYLIREIGKKILPKEIYNRKKSIFPIPPSNFETEIQEYLKPNMLMSGRLIKEIMLHKDGVENFLENLNPDQRWKLFAINRFEKVFF